MGIKQYTSTLSQINPETGYIFKQIQSSFEVDGDTIPISVLHNEFQALWDLTNGITRNQYIHSLVIIHNTDDINTDTLIYNWKGTDVPEKISLPWTDQILSRLRSLNLDLGFHEVLPRYIQIVGLYKDYEEVLNALISSEIPYHKRDTYSINGQFILTLSEE